MYVQQCNPTLSSSFICSVKYYPKDINYFHCWIHVLCLNKGRATWWHLLYYVNLLLNMFRMLIHPSSGTCDYLVPYCVGCIVLTWGVLVLCSGIGCWWCGIWVQPALGYYITNSQQMEPGLVNWLSIGGCTSLTNVQSHWHDTQNLCLLADVVTDLNSVHKVIGFQPCYLESEGFSWVS